MLLIPFPLGRLAGVLMLVASLGAGSAWAAKPEWVEDGKGGKSGKQEKHDKHGNQGGQGKGGSGKGDRQDGRPMMPAQGSSGPSVQINVGAFFGDNQRQVLRDYYGPQFRSGNCPPGLAKKNNGCLPPGQAKKWRVGNRLPGDVVYYPLPNDVVVRLGVPPAGHKYVRVAADILLIAVGTSMVVDAIEDLSRL